MKKRIIPFFVVSCILCVPLLSYAESVKQQSFVQYSEAQLIALIAKLQKQLAELRANTSQCLLADVDLSIGDGEDAKTREHVKDLQSFLREKGYLSVEPTGYFGKLTRQALIAFQSAHGLQQTGELSSSVRAKVKEFQCVKKYIKREIQEKKEEWKDEKKDVEKGGVTAITATSEGRKVSWTSVGFSRNGFKIVWSKNASPTYPTREGDKYIYLSDPKATSATIEAFAGAGTYSVRVCEYLGGKCGLYSNELRISME